MCKIISLLLVVFILILRSAIAQQSVGVNTTNPDPSAVLDVQSNSKGMLIPRLTTAQRNLIASPATGLLIFDTNTGSFWFKSATNWIELVDTLNNTWKKSGNNAHLGVSGNVGVGVTNPAFKLDVHGRIRIRTGILGNASTSSGMWLEDHRDGTNRVFIGMQDSIRAGFYGAGTNGVGWEFVFNAVNGRLTLGQSTHPYDFNIGRNSPTIGFFDLDDNVTSGIIQGNADNLYIHANRVSSLGGGTGGNLLLQTNSGGLPNFIAGNVGIGITTPDVKVHITGGTDITNATGGYIQMGSTTSTNVALDNDEIQARNDGAAAKLTVQSGGGGLQIGSGATVVNFSSTGELNRNGVTGTSNLLPLAFGKVSASGSIINSTGNFTVSHPSEGVYKITLTGESNVFANRNSYMILATPYNNSSIIITHDPIMVITGIDSDNTIEVRISRPNVNFTNSSCSGDCGPFSYITNLGFHQTENYDFSILIYKH